MPSPANPNAPARYRVVGADRDTAETIELVVTAASTEAAEEQARRRGLFVSSVSLAEPAATSTDPSSAGINAAQPSLRTQRLTVAIAAGVGMGATFLPWVRAPIVGTIDGTAGDGWITLALFAVTLALALVGDRGRLLSAGHRIGLLVPSSLAGLIGVWKIADFNSRMAEIQQDPNPFAPLLSASVQIGFGLYLVVIAAIAVLVLAFAVRR